MRVFDRISRVNDRARSLEERLGVPQYRSMVVRAVSLDESNVEHVEDTLITPTPRVTHVNPRLVGLTIGNETQSVVVSALDQQAEVSRSIPYTTFVRPDARRVRVWLDTPVENRQIKYFDGDGLQGTEMIVIHVDDRDCCHWSIILRQVSDR